MALITCKHLAVSRPDEVESRSFFQAAYISWTHPESSEGLWGLRATMQKVIPGREGKPLPHRYSFISRITVAYSHERRLRPERPPRPARGQDGLVLPGQLPEPATDKLIIALAPYMDPLTASVVAPQVAELLEQTIFSLDDALADLQEMWDFPDFSSTIDALANRSAMDLDVMVAS